MNRYIPKLTHFRYLLISVFILGLTTPCFADDLDAYIIPPLKEPANVLFLLDFSGSMGTGAGSGRDLMVKRSLTTILSNQHFSDIKVGMIKYFGSATSAYESVTTGFLLLRDKRSELLTIVSKNLGYASRTGVTPTPAALMQGVKAFLGQRSGFPSPLNEQEWCSNNRIVVMSDGEPTANNLEYNPFDSQQECDKNVKFGEDHEDFKNAGLCTKEIVAHYAPGSGRDLNTTIPGTQTLNVDSIAFSPNNQDTKDYLRDIATHGHGSYFLAGNESQLVSVFLSILQELQAASEKSFLRSTIPFDPTDAIISSNEIYIPLFEPETRTFWRGNLKKYRISVDENANIKMADKDGRSALKDDGSFLTNTTSYWTDDADGSYPLYGGFAEQLAQQHRTLYTDFNWEKLDHLTTLDSKLGADLAPSASVAQSSTYLDNAATYGAGQANDLKASTFSRTKKTKTPHPSWSMSFTQPQLIREIEITPADCCVDDMNGFIYSYIYDNNGTNEAFASSTPLDADKTHSISIDKKIRQFDITYPATTSTTTSEHVIALSEVKAFGPPLGDSTTLSWFIDAIPSDKRQRPAPKGAAESSSDYRARLSAWAESAVRVGGALHTRPVVVRYRSGQSLVSATPTQTLTSLVFLATSEGVLHAINPKTGREVWGFMPHDKLGNIANFKNTASISKDQYPEYGLDGPTRLFTTKNNKKILVFGMRRGGYTYYALDVTDPATPNLAWKISKTDTGTFQRLGQTWSPPQQIAIKLKSKTDNSVKKHDALIFGGGNNPDSDYGTSRTTTAEQGNAVYIVDLTDGEPLWWASSHNNADLTLDDMKSSIVSRIGAYNLVNREDGLVDRLYFADKGGRIFRVDFNEKTGTAKGYKFADLNDGTEQGHRQFYAPPSLGYYQRGGKEFITIAIGSGQRPDLFNDDVQNRFYVLKDHNVWTYPSTRTTTTDSHLTDLKAEYATTTLNVSGFYIDLESYEKSLDAAVIYDYRIFFTTYEGNIIKRSDVCTGGEVNAIHRLYAIDMNTGRAVHNFDNPGQAISDDFSSTHTEYSGLGLPPSLTLFVSGGTTTKDDDGNITAAVGKKLFLMHGIGSDREKIEFDLKFGPVRSWRKIYGLE